MKKFTALSAALLLTAVATAHAETTPPAPVSQGATSVNKNLAKDPDNKGLQNASQQLQTNETRIATKRAEQTQKQDAHKERHEVRNEKIERHERMERPTRMDHPGK